MAENPSTTNPAPALKPCPFDDGGGLHGMKVRDNGRDGCGPADTWWVQCKCGAEGPNTRGPEAAIAAWNLRSGDRDATIEECAKVADTIFANDAFEYRKAAYEIADAIRALRRAGETPRG